MMSGKSRRFFKIILTDVGSHTELLFPIKFLRIFGKELKDSITLNAPRGLEWSIELKRQKEKVWLQNGWPEFADCYTIRFGYLLVFEYKGDSKFEVLIFDPSSSEIDYPLARNDKPDSVKSAQVKKRLIDIDDLSTSDDSSDSDYVVRPCKKTKSESTSSEVSSTNLGQERGKAPDRVHKEKAPAVANASKSKNPSFVHVMKASHIVGGGWPNVYIPKTFKEAYKKWQSNEELILVVEGRSWDVSCNMNLGCHQCRISRGWTIFARENSLNVGDVCHFELINHSSKIFDVIISRAEEETNCEGNDNLPRVRSEVNKAKVLELVKAYKPNRPFFKVKVHKCYLYGGSMTVPLEFVKRHITNDSSNIVLQLPDGRVWSVKCYIRDQCAKLSAGWKNFSIENKLSAGDICGFELINPRQHECMISSYSALSRQHLKLDMAKPSCFFKIILSDVDGHDKLVIPTKFVSIHGKNLDDNISLRVPSGSVWSIRLIRHRNKVWLQNGWPEFAKFYSICFGYLLVFEYKGDSQFQVLVFDPSALEIDYPLTSTTEDRNVVKSARGKKRVVDSDDSTSVDVVRPCKRTTASSPCKEARQDGLKFKQKKVSAERNGGALASAKAFKSTNSFFIHVMKSSNVVGAWPNVYITNTFEEAYKNWKNHDKVILQVANRTWTVYCSMNSNQCRFSRKWGTFARENSLDVDDVCVFELINPSRKLLRVFIFRGAGETTC